MGFFGKKDGIVGAVLGVSGAFDKNKKTDKAAAFGAAIGASIGSGRQWTFEDSLKLGVTINALDSMKSSNTDDSDTYTSGLNSGASYSGHAYNNLILDSEQEEQLEEAGIDSFEFEMMDDDEKIEALEDAGLDPLDFDIY